MILAITGHTNIEKAIGKELKYQNGQKYDSQAFEIVLSEIESGLKKYCSENDILFEDLTLVSGMARGIDEIFAILAIRNKLKLILSIPGSIKWHSTRSLSRNMRAQAVYYSKILAYEKIVAIYEVSKTYNNENWPLVNLARNQQMVDIANGVFCYKAYDSTGTDDCIKRAKKANKFLGNFCTKSN